MALIVALILVCAHQWDRSFLTAGENIETVWISPMFWKSNLSVAFFFSVPSNLLTVFGIQ